MNLFAGGRRLTYLAMALVAVVTAWIASNSTFTSADVFYVAESPEGKLTKTTIGCDREKYEVREDYIDLGGGLSANANLCFRKERGMDVGFSTEEILRAADFRERVDYRVSDFELPRSDIGTVRQYVVEETSRLTRQNQIGVVKVGAIIIAILFIISLAFGWIARGFAGIPVGRDQREKQNDA